MAWPQPHEYNEAIQNPRSCFNDLELRQGQPVTSRSGLPIPISGNFAVVYQVKAAANGQTWAVKCFTREVPGLRDRYREISAHLQKTKIPYTVGFQYLDPGICIQRQWFPVLKMGWAAGAPLNEFVKSAVDKPQLLEALAELWLVLARNLRGAQVAHADLQHGNVLLVPEQGGRSLKLKLVDYDGMFVPGLSRTQSAERGHPNYQHPQRLSDGTYDAEVDRFSHLVIYCALRCLAIGGPALWTQYDNGENLLFREADFKSPGSSPLFKELWNLGGPIQNLVGHLILASRSRIDQVPLLDDLLSNGQVLTLTPVQKSQVEPRRVCLRCRGQRVCPCANCTSGKVRCAACQGRRETRCSTCHGNGESLCTKCGGSGESRSSGLRTCPTCGGTGTFVRQCHQCMGGFIFIPGFFGPTIWPCPYCGGMPVQFNTCTTCEGRGSTRRPPKRCTACQGTGQGSCSSCCGRGTVQCSGCSGLGEERCSQCSGTGRTDCLECLAKARIVSVTQEYDTVRDGEKGMLIHIAFEVGAMRGETGHIAAYFFSANGTPLQDADQQYRSGNGQVSVGEGFVPAYDATVWKDFQLFMPYSQLHLLKGRHDLKLHVEVFKQEGGSWQHLGRSPEQTFRVSQP